MWYAYGGYKGYNGNMGAFLGCINMGAKEVNMEIIRELYKGLMAV
jgi:hypothetical protein